VSHGLHDGECTLCAAKRTVVDLAQEEMTAHQYKAFERDAASMADDDIRLRIDDLQADIDMMTQGDYDGPLHANKTTMIHICEAELARRTA
jgi:hypothetical protein